MSANSVSPPAIIECADKTTWTVGSSDLVALQAADSTYFWRVLAQMGSQQVGLSEERRLYWVRELAVPPTAPTVQPSPTRTGPSPTPKK